MGKGSKIFGTLLLVLGVACIAMYFVIGDKFSNYKVIFDTDGGSAIAEQVIKKGEKVTKPNDPAKENNEFVEWLLDGVAYNFDKVVEKNMTLKAKWNEIVNHNVKVTLDGQEYTSIVRDGEVVVAEAFNLPDKEGYLIKFYSEDNQEYDINTRVTTDLNLSASYVQIKYYTVKFNSNGGSKVEDAKVQDGNTVTAPESTRDGYILDGWYLGEEKFDFSTPITKDISLKARWNDGPKINVIFMVDGKVYKTIPVSENTVVKKPTNPTKDKHRFVEWQLNGTAFDFSTKITNETTLEARFEEVTSFTVTFNSDGGSIVPSQTVTDKVTKPASPTKTGYRFVEWQLNGKKYDFNATVTSDIQLKAKWEELEKYTIRFNDDEDKEITTRTVYEGEKVTKPSDPSKDGHRFVGWLYNNQLYDFNKVVTSNMVLTARFERINPDVNENGEQ